LMAVDWTTGGGKKKVGDSIMKAMQTLTATNRRKDEGLPQPYKKKEKTGKKFDGGKLPFPSTHFFRSPRGKGLAGGLMGEEEPKEEERMRRCWVSNDAAQSQDRERVLWKRGGGVRFWSFTGMETKSTARGRTGSSPLGS